MIYTTMLSTPFLPMVARLSETHLLTLSFEVNFPEDKLSPSPPALAGEIEKQLRAYFEGKLKTFTLPYALATGTPFQHSCWEILTQIPYGETLTYGEQAGRLGKAGASRAVGSANGKNPLSIIIPCHRVIGRDGSLRGYSTPDGMNLDLKRSLLDLEKIFL